MGCLLRPQILRQALILGGMMCCSITVGLVLGQMSGLLADLQKKEGSIILNDNEISWIASTTNLTCIGGYLLSSIISTFLGRRKTIISLNALIIFYWIVMYYAHNMALLMFSRIIAGIGFGGLLELLFTVTSEYASPEVRALCIYIISGVGVSSGVALGHILCTILHWRIVALIGIIPAALSTISPHYWVESPPWLASKGRFNECEASFIALHGHRQEAQKELELLLELEKEKIIEEKNNFKQFFFALKKRYFWKLCSLFTIIGIYRMAAAKIYFVTYGISILKDITGSSDILFTLLVDGFNVIGSILSCILITKMKTRTLLFSLGITADVLIIVLSICLYFQHKDSTYFPWINSFLMGLYFILINAGPYPVLETLIAEVVPIEVKYYFFLFVGGLLSVLIFVYMKVITDIVATIGYSGTLFLHALVSTVLLFYFWWNIPETKGKTLQELEITIKGLHNSIRKDKFKEQVKALY